MQCHYYDASLCRSCSLILTPYAQQLEGKQSDARKLMAPWPGIEWLAPVASAETGFRNKAKLVVGGSVQEPRLGILSRDGASVDLSDCQLYTAPVADTFPVLKELISRAGLTPYSVARRKGELKNILVTASEAGELLIRFVLRSKKLLVPIRRELDWLHTQLPQLAVLSINLLREHIALVEGDEEIILSERQTLPMQVNDLTLHLRPQSFFQTNTAVSAALYRQGQEWVKESQPNTLWDLYCGVGGFALHAAQVMPEEAKVTGIEISPEAIESARRAVAEYDLTGIEFSAQDARAYALESGQVPDLLVLNPPRRGLGPELSTWIEASGIERVIYSSCNLATMVKDLHQMPSMQAVKGRVMDMFPHSSHYETIVLLERYSLS
ncbi:23S rRNA (uracil(747)-C(5))-methyltransferase RlmC [Rothia sp. P4278]|uniref:23S rRNA (uracil(747)-C(5))-methyltransferase RlmC n=1 Tax=unclassified Rothia (in: high G+C Gram-positive bacteria) TaxID=2689056 RepID=UPI003AD976EF